MLALELAGWLKGREHCCVEVICGDTLTLKQDGRLIDCLRIGDYTPLALPLEDEEITDFWGMVKA